jgi:hypothetical protein
METTFIYALVDPRNGQVRYIGKANRPTSRFSSHIKNPNGSYHKVNWIKELAKYNLIPELFILDEVNFSEWPFWEAHYISLYKSFGFDLTNASNGGEGNDGYKHTDEDKYKSGSSMRGKILGPRLQEVKDKIRLKQKGIVNIGKEPVNKGITGVVKASKETIIKLRESKAKTPKILCNHCKVLVDPQNYALWHRDHCYDNPLVDEKVEKQRRFLLIYDKRNKNKTA